MMCIIHNVQASTLMFVQLSGTSENWRRTSRSCITVVRRDKWKNLIPIRAGMTDKSISTGIKYWVCCIKESWLQDIKVTFKLQTCSACQNLTILQFWSKSDYPSWSYCPFFINFKNFNTFRFLFQSKFGRFLFSGFREEDLNVKS
jgi:hypothetical protein